MNVLSFYSYWNKAEIYDFENNMIGDYWKFVTASDEEINGLNLPISEFYKIYLEIKNLELKEKFKERLVKLIKTSDLSNLNSILKTDLISDEEKIKLFQEKLDNEIIRSDESKFNYNLRLKEIGYYLYNFDNEEFVLKNIKKVLESISDYEKDKFRISIIELFSYKSNIFNELLKYFDKELPIQYKEYLKANGDSNYINGRQEYDIDIGIDPKISIGLEIETNYTYPYTFRVSNQIGYENYRVTTDATVPNGIEVITPPFHNTKEEVSKFCKLCDALSDMGYYYNEDSLNASGQINIGLDYLDSSSSIQTFYELYCNCEELLYYISNEKGQVFRQNIYSSSRIKPISEVIGKRIFDEDISRQKLINFFQNEDENLRGIYYKKNSVCLRGNSEYDYRFEFRMPNGGVNYNTWIDNIRLFGKIVETSKKISELLNKENLTKEEEKMLDLKLKLEDEELSLEEKLVTLMNLLFKDKQIRNIYYERFAAIIKKIKEENIDNYERETLINNEPSFSKVEFADKYVSKIDNVTVSYDPDTGEYIDNRKRTI